MGWNGMGWDGILEWDGMGWNGMEWDGMGQCPFYGYSRIWRASEARACPKVTI
jgi:hypothetical protein